MNPAQLDPRIVTPASGSRYARPSGSQNLDWYRGELKPETGPVFESDDFPALWFNLHDPLAMKAAFESLVQTMERMGMFANPMEQRTGHLVDGTLPPVVQFPKSEGESK